MKAASFDTGNLSSLITRTTPRQRFPTKYTRTHFLKLHQSPPKNSFLGASANPFTSFLSISSSFNSFIESNAFLGWNKVPEIVEDRGGEVKALGTKDRVITVVLVGWLGGTTKHLKRYVEWYNSRGIHAVTFVLEVKDLLCFDPVAMLEQRIAELGNEIARWALEEEEDGRERCFLFHTFSNTGWLIYGALLDRFKGREELREKIRGVIIDSGGSSDPLNPKVWAAGFAAAILKKFNSNSSTNGLESAVTDPKLQKEKPEITEAVVLSSLEKLFTFLLTMPEVNRKFTAVINATSEHCLPCPQLYLYSTADKVIPYKSVELCIEEISKKGNPTSGGFLFWKKMNDLMTKSFLSYVELKKQAEKDLEAEAEANLDIEKGLGQLNPMDEKNLSRFFQEVESIKTLMEEITNLVFDLQTLNEDTKSTHSAKVLRGIRDRMESDTVSILGKAKVVKARLESLDRANATNRRLSEAYKQGSCVDRTRISITNGLRAKLRGMMNDFQALREKILSDHKEDLKRRYYNATGELPSEDVHEKVVSGGGKVQLFEEKLEMDSRCKERHEAVIDIQRSLERLHQVFLDMAVLVEAQGEKMDDIEENVANAGNFISGGTNSLYYANQMKKKKAWVYWVWGVALIILLVCIISMLAS
ncbi:hypothetical protein PTKIN_Ptkin08bG0186400 [Pterospermum kingtungense]